MMRRGVLRVRPCRSTDRFPRSPSAPPLGSAHDEISRRAIPHAGIRLQGIGGVVSARRAARPYRGVDRVKGGKGCPLMEVRIFANYAPTRSRSPNPTKRRMCAVGRTRPYVDGPRSTANSTGGCNTLDAIEAEGVLQMKQRPRIYYSGSQKALMWDRWQKGETL